MRLNQIIGPGAILLGLASNSFAKEQYLTTDEKRDSSWTIGLQGVQHALKSGDGNNSLLGAATAVQIGYSKMSDNWIVTSSLDVISGPYLTPSHKDAKLDYTGTGCTITVSSSAEQADVRTHNGNYGFSVGLTYIDIAGREVGERKQQGARTDNYVMRVTDWGIVPAIFFTWLEPKARLETNRPDDLYTRIEGYHLNLGFVVPLLANYNLRYDVIDGDKRYTEREKGTFAGFTITVSFSALLGV